MGRAPADNAGVNVRGSGIGRVVLAALAAAALASALAACGDDDEPTTTETEAPLTTTDATSTTSTSTATSTTSTTSSTSTATTGGTSPDDCTNGQVFSESSGTCVEPNEDGGNPCPEGEVPMADEPVCVPKD